MAEKEPWQVYAEAQAEEWGQFVAKVKIYYDGVLAYDVGYPVPVSNVEKFDYEEQGLVERVAPSRTSRSAKAAKPKEG